ncbi:MAG TPA: hypothetical protein VNA88_15805 [Candidatus Kapabacteria bacterium]|jgi:hypothetical protein|nr:hypothetical protein [Candidatus Kapabacteria bacterium]
MPSTINWTLNAQVVGGPKVITSDSTPVEAYDFINVTIPSSPDTVEVEVQPSAGRVTFLMITSDIYHESDLSYTVDAETTVIRMDSPQLFVGAGIMALFGGGPGSLIFTNTTNEPANIRILVGRDATP